LVNDNALLHDFLQVTRIEKPVLTAINLKGLMIPEGINHIGHWTDVNGGRPFCLFEANGPENIIAWL